MSAPAVGGAVSAEEFAALEHSVRRLEREVDALRSELAALRGGSSGVR